MTSYTSLPPPPAASELPVSPPAIIAKGDMRGGVSGGSGSAADAVTAFTAPAAALAASTSIGPGRARSAGAPVLFPPLPISHSSYPVLAVLPVLPMRSPPALPPGAPPPGLGPGIPRGHWPVWSPLEPGGGGAVMSAQGGMT
ncbi:hypothetical protein Vretifemale_5914 [Volvox reticuliferus]|uniref:Uncharacterized protein n=1 Tax=Volvox reticuliferus TaxID=1737510 RepID=A0A8J4FIB6_9CHLO|nr:hypothetical protein Vretifemale_5914 [Volvox reticuliferus]